MTDRLQRFELKIFVCVLLKKQSGCPWGKQVKFSFLGELSCTKIEVWKYKEAAYEAYDPLVPAKVSGT